MRLDDKNIKEILLQENYISSDDLKKAENLAKNSYQSLVDVCIGEGMITKNLLGQALAEHYNTSFVDLHTTPPAKDDLLLLAETVARKFHAAVCKVDKKQVIVATDDPEQKELTTKLNQVFTGQKVKLVFAFEQDITDTFSLYRKTLETRFSEIIKSEKRVAPEIIDEIIADALAFYASDIHIEPQVDHIVVRFRIDGVLHEAGIIPKEFQGNIINRIKVQAQLPIDEHFSAQDGAIRFQNTNNVVDIRVSIIPTLNGEKVVMRLLAQYVQSFTFQDLGLNEANQHLLDVAVHKPFGMILVIGPTGSGKSTTLYALLKILNQPGVNITTIEDPVEYKIAGVNQIQVNPDTNLTFANGLRSIARQDPDIILVGEIRDKETAEISVNAALTGHLLFSTFHANDSATAIPRLLEMGTEPFLLASTLQLLVAQRLVRRICPRCRTSVHLSEAEKKKKIPSAVLRYFDQKATTLYMGSGCTNCGQTGFRGRVAIFEFIQVTPEMQNLVMEHPSAARVWELARKQGSLTLFEDGIEKVKNGMTTLEELLRVAEPPKY